MQRNAAMRYGGEYLLPTLLRKIIIYVVIKISTDGLVDALTHVMLLLKSLTGTWDIFVCLYQIKNKYLGSIVKQ